VSALSPIARAEFRLHLRSRGYWLLFALFVALVATAAVLNRTRQVRDRAQQLGYQQLVRAQWESQPDRHPHRVAHYGTFAFKPPGPLAAFDPGVESYTGRVQYLEAHRQNAANFAEAGALSAAFRLGELSLAFILQLVLPLIVIVLGHRALADEAESGRLRLLLAQGVALRTLAFGKLLGLAAALVPFLLVGLAASRAAVVTDPAFAADSAAVARLGVVGLALALHTAAWLALTVWVSARARTAARACAVLVTLWIFGGVILPRAAGALATRLHPLPDKTAFAAAVAAEVKTLGDSHDPNDPHFAKLRQETLARYGAARPEDLPVNLGAIIMARGEELSAATFARHLTALGVTMQTQADLVQRTTLLAPPLAFRTLTTAAAGTDLRAALEFQRAAEAYRYEFVQALNTLHRDEVRYATDRDTRLSAANWKRFADFRAPPPSLRVSLAGTSVAWLALALWIALPLATLVPRQSRPL